MKETIAGPDTEFKDLNTMVKKRFRNATVRTSMYRPVAMGKSPQIVSEEQSLNFARKRLRRIDFEAVESAKRIDAKLLQ